MSLPFDKTNPPCDGECEGCKLDCEALRIRKEIFTVYLHKDGAIELETPEGRQEIVHEKELKAQIQGIINYFIAEEEYDQWIREGRP